MIRGGSWARVQAPKARDALEVNGDDLLERVLANGARSGPPPPPPPPPPPVQLATAASPAPAAPVVTPGSGGGPGRSRLDDIEARLARLETCAYEIPSLERGVVALLRAHKAESERIDALPAAVERLVAQHVTRLVEEHLDALDEEESSVPDDLEGVYKELDQLAELINDRDAVVEASIERIESLERSVGRLRRNLEGALRQLAETRERPAGAGLGGRGGGETAAPAVAALGSLGDGLPGVDAALERARRRRELSRPPD